MACPASGEIRLARIRGEFESNNYNNSYTNVSTSLGQASIGTYGSINTYNAPADRPDQSQPHAMSEFYSYDHDYNPAPDYSATMTVGTATIYSTSFAGYGISSPINAGSLSNTSFNNNTITHLYHQTGGSGGGYIYMKFMGSKPTISDLTVGSTTYSSWSSYDTYTWRHAASTNPFGTSGTVSISGNY